MSLDLDVRYKLVRSKVDEMDIPKRPNFFRSNYNITLGIIDEEKIHFLYFFKNNT